MPNLRNKIWKNLPDQSTPITADDLNFIEDHLFDGTGGSAGHKIVDENGTVYEDKEKLKFVGTGEIGRASCRERV